MRQKLLKISSLVAMSILLASSLLVFPVNTSKDFDTTHSDKSTHSIVAKSDMVLSISSNIQIKVAPKVFETTKKTSTPDGLKSILHSLNINHQSFNGIFYSHFYKIGFHRATLRAILYPFHFFF